MTTEINHVEYPKSLKTKSAEELRWIIKDCKEAMNAMPCNPKNGYYQDEINYCANELYFRKQGN